MANPEPSILDFAPMRARRDAFYARAREAVFEWVNPDGTSRGPHKVFAGTSAGNIYPNREPFRSSPCLYTGEQRHIDLANAMVARYCHTPPPAPYRPPTYAPDEDRSLQFGIFQSNNAAAILHKYGDLPAKKAAMKMLGYDCGTCRRPFVPLPEETTEDLRRALTAIGFFEG